MQALGFEGLGQRAIRLSADTIRTHEDRFGGFGRADWLRVQRLVDEGAVVEQGARPSDRRGSGRNVDPGGRNIPAKQMPVGTFGCT